MRWRGAFSTLGCAGRPLEDVVRLAVAGGWQGLELRAAEGEPVHVGLGDAERRAVRGLLRDAGLAPLAIASYVEIDDPAATDAAVVADALAHAELARDIGAPFVRLFPGGPSGNGAAGRRLTAIVRELGDGEVAMALETHDSCSCGRDVADLLAHVDDARARAIWDVQHPWRAGEHVAETATALMPYLAYVQITDARSLGDPTPALPGAGVLPLRELYDELAGRGYDGWVSLEWASYWFPDAPPLEAALPRAQSWLRGSLS